LRAGTDTILRWYPEPLVAREYDGSLLRRPGPSVPRRRGAARDPHGRRTRAGGTPGW